MLYPSRPGADPYPWITDVTAAFGQPARINYVDGYTVMVWNNNLLAELLPIRPVTSALPQAGSIA